MTRDTRIHDETQLEEIELYGVLVIAASAHEGPLTSAEVDELLGVRPVDARDTPSVA